MLALTLSLCLGGLVADAPRSATLQLEELKASPLPGLAPPIILYVAAVTTLVTGAVMFVLAGATSVFVGATVVPLLIVGIVAVALSGGLVIAGGVMMTNALRARRERAALVHELEEQLPPPVEAPPPPTSVQGPAPALLLATF